MARQFKAVVALAITTLSIGASTAVAAPPVVTIDPAPLPSYTTVEVKGTVDPADHDVFYAAEVSADPESEGWLMSAQQFLAAGSGETDVAITVSGLKPSTEYEVRLVAENFPFDPPSYSPEPNPTFTTLGPIGPATVSIDPVTTVGGTTAHFSGTIDPQAPAGGPAGFEVNWRFECTPACPGLEGTLPADSDPHPVEADATGLEPNTDYEVSLIAENAGGPSSAGPEQFSTDPTAPQVMPLYAGLIDSDSAVLGAEVNPRNSPTSYFVEYTEIADVGFVDAHRIPAEGDPDLGSGSSFVTAAQQVEGLQPDTAYRFRVVAENDSDERTVGPDRVFVTNPSPSPPPTRGYELVSPRGKGGADIFNDDLGRAAPSGQKVSFGSKGTFADPAAGGIANQYRATRSDSGWATVSLNPNVPDPYPYPAEATRPVWISEDVSSYVFVTYSGDLVEGAPKAHNFFAKTDDGYELLTNPTVPVPPEDPEFGPPEQMYRFFRGATPDFSRAVFDMIRPLVPNTSTVGGRNVYEWDNSEGQGIVRLVSVLPGPGEPAADSAEAGRVEASDGNIPGAHVISDDGSRIFFTDSSTLNLYVRENHATTTLISGSEVTGDDPTVPVGGARYEAASADGAAVFFLHDAKLTDDSTASPTIPDLYLWNADAPVGGRLTDLTIADPDGAGVLGVTASTDDGDAVAFVATGALAEGAIDGRPNLYLWRSGEGVRFIATVSQEDEGLYAYLDDSDGRGESWRNARITEDGDRLLFASRAQLTTSQTNGSRQIYLFDAGEGFVRCISCVSRVPIPSSGSNLVTRGIARSSTADVAPEHAPPWLARNLSADGSRVFFDSPDPLVAEDSDGRMDVYLWEAGELSLVSSGRSDDNSLFLDAGANGDDVFFTTRERLVGADIDRQVDVYDARVGGGFAEPAEPPTCEGDACQPPPNVPTETTPASESYRGPGNVPRAKQRCAKGKRLRNGRCVKKRHGKKRQGRPKGANGEAAR